MSKDLFQLIKSLSPTEKRYFKVNAASGDNSTNYIRLFNVIDKMENYDENLVRKKIQNEPFLENLHVNKNYLYQVILRTLRNYYEKKSVDLKLHNLLIDVIILNRKGQYDQVKKILQRIKKLAVKHDSQMFLLAAIQQEIKLSFTKPNKLGREINDLCQQLNKHLKIFDNEIQLGILLNKVFLAQRTHFTFSQLDIDDNIETNPLLKTLPELSNFNLSFLYHRILAAYYHLSKERQQAFEHYHNIIEMWESQDHFIKDKPYLFKIQLSNYLCICHELSQYENFVNILSKIKSIPSQSFDEEAETFQNVAYYELLYYMNTLQFNKAKVIVPGIQQGLKRYARKVNKARLLAFWYNLSILFFAIEDFENALNWLTNILNEPKTEHRQDIQYFARFLELIYHFELENYQVFDYLLRSLIRFVNQKKEVASSFELLLLHYFKKLPSLLSGKESKYVFQTFYEKLENLPLKEKRLPCVEEISLWTETKVTGSSFLEIMQQKINKTDQ